MCIEEQAQLLLGMTFLNLTACLLCIGCDRVNFRLLPGEGGGDGELVAGWSLVASKPNFKTSWT